MFCALRNLHDGIGSLWTGHAHRRDTSRKPPGLHKAPLHRRVLCHCRPLIEQIVLRSHPPPARDPAVAHLHALVLHRDAEYHVRNHAPRHGDGRSPGAEPWKCR
jgi:hypothetical protein